MNKFWFLFIRRIWLFILNKGAATEEIRFNLAKEYYSKITRHCKENGILIILSLKGTNSVGKKNGRYDISLNSLDCPAEVVATALHELGHIIRWEELNAEGSGDFVNNLFIVQAGIYFGILSIRGTELLYLEEVFAWKRGEEFAIKNGIELGPWFFEVKRRSLASYERLMEKAIKIGE